MIRIAYLYDGEGWALHRLGTLLATEMAQDGIHIECFQSDAWHANPHRADTVYLSYSSLLEEAFDYSRWCDSLITTVHDPCEVSHFEDRASWYEGPFIDLPLNRFDRISACSAEMTELLGRVYRVNVWRTPTWPTVQGRSAVDLTQAAVSRPIQAVSSTILPEFFPLRRILGRLRSLRPYLHDHNGRISFSQMRGLFVVRRRKNIPWLRAMAKRFAGKEGIVCSFRSGTDQVLPREEYERQMREADIYVCTSTMEGGPLPVLEAVWGGQAVISTPVGQVEEWVTDGVNGRICRTLDEFEAALEAYRLDHGLLRRHQAGSRARAAAATFPRQAWADFFLGNPKETA